jgi:hypothetical protein
MSRSRAHLGIIFVTIRTTRSWKSERRRENEGEMAVWFVSKSTVLSLNGHLLRRIRGLAA